MLNRIMTENIDCALKCNLLRRKSLRHRTQLFEMMVLTEEAIQKMFKQKFNNRNLAKTLIHDPVAFILAWYNCNFNNKVLGKFSLKKK